MPSAAQGLAVVGLCEGGRDWGWSSPSSSSSSCSLNLGRAAALSLALAQRRWRSLMTGSLMCAQAMWC